MWANEIGPDPFVGGTQRFKLFIDSGKEFKWILGEKNGIVVINPTLKHSIAAGGDEVITAGQGQKKGEGEIGINNDTGHYQTTHDSFDLARDAWKRLGYNVEIRKMRNIGNLF